MGGNIRRGMNKSQIDELERIKRVSDMLVTAHAFLKERYARLSLTSDILLFSCATILCVIVFADQKTMIDQFGKNFNLFLGVFAVISFIFAFISSQLDWKIKAEKHKNAFEKYTEIKFECENILKKFNNDECGDAELFLKKYYTLTPYIISIPEKLFVECKRHHVLKVFISKYLDEHPGTWVFILKIKIWIRDNFRFLK